MPRRNNRYSEIPSQPLPVEVIHTHVHVQDKTRWVEEHEFNAARDRGARRWEEVEARQQASRIANSIDWEVCVIPGCAERSWTESAGAVRGKTHDPTRELPLCHRHLTIAWSQMQRWRGHPDLIKSVEEMNEAARRKAAAEEAEEKSSYLAEQWGEIYFIRLNDLIKVGWSRSVPQRLKSYGASAELLVHYPAHRNDETTLHRQLRPALAKGREWYHDSDIVQLFLTEALNKYGAPTAQAYWTEPGQTQSARLHRSSRRHPGIPRG